MLTVKYDNIVKDKIDTLTAVPEEFVFDASAKWQRLEDKLQPQPDKKKAIWWYCAAASLLIIFSTLIWLNGSKQIGIAAVSNSPKIITPQINKIQQNAIVKQFQKHENISLKTIKTSENNIAAIIDKTDNVEVEKEPFTAASNLIVADISIANMVDTVVQKNNIKTPVATIKTKRKVIHINDFGEAILQPMLATRNEYKQTHEQEENTTPVDANKSWWLFKPKPTTVNTFTNTSLTENQ